MDEVKIEKENKEELEKIDSPFDILFGLFSIIIKKAFRFYNARKDRLEMEREWIPKFKMSEDDEDYSWRERWK